MDLTPTLYNKRIALLSKHDDSNSFAPHVINTSSSGLSSSLIHNARISLGKQWIIDTDATYHLCSFLQLFYSYHAIKPITVRFPNGSHILSKKSGTVKLNEYLTLYNVLFVPGFNCNLISAYQLSFSNQCRLLFYHCSCVIQEQSSLRMVGLTKVYNNLYLLSQDSSIFYVYNDHVPMKSCNYNVSTKFTLWHHRLGHPS